MSDFNRRGVTLSRPERPRSRFADLGDRFARAFSPRDQTQASHKANGQPDHAADGEPPVLWDESPPRFPIARQGYECAAVDAHIAELEHELIALDQELAQLPSQTPAAGEVATEIQRVGEQTSAILIAAHEQAQQTTRLAQEEAESCIAAAAANAVSLTSEAKEELRELEREKGSLSQERERLITDIRSLSAALSSLADGAEERFPPEPHSAGPSPEVAATPGDQSTVDG